MTARQGTLDDVDEIVRLGALMFESMGIASEGAWRERAIGRVQAGLTDGSVGACVVDDPQRPGHLIASACASLAARLPGPMNATGVVAYVQYVCTEAHVRGQGHGRAVMSALLDWCREQGAGSVELHATDDGLALYRALGFIPGPNPALRLSLP